jgi:TctA family transporter
MQLNTILGFSLPGAAEWIMILIFLPLFIWWIITIIQIAKGRFEGDNTKLVWLLIVILLGILGLLIYKVAGPKPVRE